jgi:hypothetical protein
MAILPIVFLLFFFVFLFVREIELDKKRLANEHFLREVELFLEEKAMKNK